MVLSSAVSLRTCNSPVDSILIFINYLYIDLLFDLLYFHQLFKCILICISLNHIGQILALVILVLINESFLIKKTISLEVWPHSESYTTLIY